MRSKRILNLDLDNILNFHRIAYFSTSHKYLVSFWSIGGNQAVMSGVTQGRPSGTKLLKINVKSKYETEKWFVGKYKEGKIALIGGTKSCPNIKFWQLRPKVILVMATGGRDQIKIWWLGVLADAASDLSWLWWCGAMKGTHQKPAQISVRRINRTVKR